jgi:hypothetical protein
MIKPNGIMKDQLVISISPIISDPLFSVNDQRLDAQQLESGRNAEPCLASA